VVVFPFRPADEISLTTAIATSNYPHITANAVSFKGENIFLQLTTWAS
jgi:hypothetical protein